MCGWVSVCLCACVCNNVLHVVVFAALVLVCLFV